MEKLNIAEILRHCPKGMELYSTVHGKMNLEGVFTLIHCKSKDNNCSLFFYPDGRWIENRGECILFPSKENRDWSTFQRPFEDGDIVFYNDTIAIFKEWDNEISFRTYVTKYLCCDSLIDINTPLFGENVRKEIRLATEEEKQKLFDAIKANGYRWNAETKTLEKLIEPKFKVGYRIQFNPNTPVRTIIQLESDRYRLNNGCYIKFGDEHAYKVLKFNITSLKPFDKVLVRDSNKDKWNIDFFACYRDSGDYQCMTFTKNQCIPYEGNEHLLDTTIDCDDYYKTWE